MMLELAIDERYMGEETPKVVYVPANTVIKRESNKVEFYTKDPSMAVVINWRQNKEKCLISLSGELCYVKKQDIYQWRGKKNESSDTSDN